MSVQPLASPLTAACTPRERSLRAPIALALAAAALSAGGADVAAAAAEPVPVPCTNVAGRFSCAFNQRPGAPVQATSGATVGTLGPGLRRVICQRLGGTVTIGANYNNHWALVVADNRVKGWVNAVYARGGAFNGPFALVRSCTGPLTPPAGNTPLPTPPPGIPLEWSNGPVDAPVWHPALTSFNSIACGSKAIPAVLQPESVSHGWTARTEAIVNVIRGPLFGWVAVGGGATGGRSGHVSNSYHYCGRAIDSFAPGVTAGTRAAGPGLVASWRLANWAAHNAPSLNVTQVIFYDRIWTAERGGWRPYSNPGGSSNTLAHRDHVHISVF
jgi:hypothetical protein